MENSWTVYIHITPNNKYYIGITKFKPSYRWGKDGYGYREQLLWRAIQKYGWDNIQHIVLADNLSKEWACKLEQDLIWKYKSNNPKYGYNLSIGGDSNAGYHQSEDAKLKISIASKSGGFKGHHHTNESKEKISKSKTGKSVPHTAEHIKKIADSNKGKKRTEQQKLKMSVARTGIYHTQETKDKISKTVKEKNLVQYLNNPEVREKMLQKKRIKIELYDSDNTLIKTFKSMTDCANYLDISVSLISMIINGKRTWKNYNIKRSK